MRGSVSFCMEVDVRPGHKGAVLITGASTGIGRVTALLLAREGFRVFAGVRREADGERLRAAASGGLTPVMLDVTDASSIDAAARGVEGAAGPGGLAGLVNNAGIVISGPLEVLPLDELRRQFEVNVFGLVATTQAFLPMIRRGGGRVVNVGSISGRVAFPFLGPYCATKFALEALSDALRMELRPWGIHVVGVLPGSVVTPIWEKSRALAEESLERLPAEKKEPYRERMNRFRDASVESGRDGISADSVACVILRALTEKRPRTRYLVGRNARVGALLAHLLPDRAMDWLVERKLGLARGA